MPRVKHKREPPEAGDIYVGRPSKWGNPFVVGQLSRAEAIARHADWLQKQPHLMSALSELRGHNLVCWCAPRACHADTLLKLANSPEAS